MNAPDPLALPVSESEMARLETALARAVWRDEPLLDELATHLIKAGGKRLRPALSLASASLSGDETSEDTVTGAVSVELVHLASLYHDDVMDEATQRRNVQSVNARWGNLLAIVAGDYLLSRSAELAASLGAEVAQLIAATLGRLCQGQVSEVRSAFDVERSQSEYFDAIGNKTAALMSTACRMGGITARLDRPIIDALTTYGECLGIVFQIRDDVLDIVATEQDLGKPPGQDLAEGIYTLPTQLALLDRDVEPTLRPLLGRRLAGERLEHARSLVASSTGVAGAATHARRFVEKAVEVAGLLDDDVVTKAFVQLGVGLVEDLEGSAAALAH